MKPFHETAYGTLYCGDCLDILPTLADNSVDTCITSPPYWGLRDYGTAEWIGGDANCDHKVGRFEYACNEKQKSNSGSSGWQAKETCPKCGAIRVDSQLGLEKTPEDYVANMVQLFREVRRTLKDDGVLWLNLGDSYAGGSGRWGGTDPNNMTSFQSANKGSLGQGKSKKWHHPVIKPKDLVGIPWRVAFALQADGWYLRQDIIWHKPNPMPESVTDRCTKSHEYIFLMSKSARYYFDNDAIKELGSSNYVDQVKQMCGKRPNYAMKTEQYAVKGGIAMSKNPELRNKRSVWTVNTKPFKEAHFATYPPELISPCVLASKPDAVILDPFFGSGTTGLVAVQNGRKYIGIELNADYCSIAARRIELELNQTDIFRKD